MWQVIGQPKAVSLLEHGFKTGCLSHAYLFVGPPHVGKMTLALNLAQVLNCPEAEPPCGQCAVCRRIAAAKHPDVRIIGLNLGENSTGGRLRAEIGIDEIRELQHAASLPPYEGKHKVFIIDGAEHLSNEAANCLLKTLEEPQPQVLLLLLAAEERVLLPTVVSRCQRVELRLIPPLEIEEALNRRWGVPARKANLLSRLSGGSLGWAVSAVVDDRLLSQRAGGIAKLIQLTATGYEGRFTYAAELATRSREYIGEVLGLWLGWWRDLLLIKGGCSAAITNFDFEETLGKEAKGYSLAEIESFIRSLQAAQEQLTQNANPRLVAEVLMLNMPGKEEGGKR